MLTTQYYLIDVPHITSYLDLLDQENPERTHGHMDIFLQNLQKNIGGILQESDNKVLLEVNHDKLQVSLLWEELPISSRQSLWESYPPTKESVYEFFLNTQEQEKRLGHEWVLIKEIYPS